MYGASWRRWVPRLRGLDNGGQGAAWRRPRGVGPCSGPLAPHCLLQSPRTCVSQKCPRPARPISSPAGTDPLERWWWGLGTPRAGPRRVDWGDGGGATALLPLSLHAQGRGWAGRGSDPAFTTPRGARPQLYWPLPPTAPSSQTTATEPDGVHGREHAGRRALKWPGPGGLGAGRGSHRPPRHSPSTRKWPAQEPAFTFAQEP